MPETPDGGWILDETYLLEETEDNKSSEEEKDGSKGQDD